MAAVEPHGDGCVVVLDEGERDVLDDLAGQMLQLLHAADDRDPIARRLFPDAYDLEPEARAYAELVGDELNAEKTRSFATMKEMLRQPRIELDEHSTDAWLRALTDMRLALGTRIEVTEKTMEEGVDPSDPRAPVLDLIHWLAWLQESMLRAVTS